MIPPYSSADNPPKIMSKVYRTRIVATEGCFKHKHISTEKKLRIIKANIKIIKLKNKNKPY